MRAVLLRAHGSVPVLGDRPAPEPRSGSLLVRVTAAPIVPLDLLCATGTSYFGAQPVPYVPGCQGVGVTGDGHRVWFTTTAGQQPGDGSMAELCAVDPDRTVALPAGVPDPLVAALGLSSVAAWGALRRGGFAAGDHVVVLGATGVVGQVALQLARAGGAGRVVAVVRAGGEDTVAALDPDEVVPIGADAADLTAGIQAACADRVDLVIDPVWGMPGAAALAALGWGGRHVNLGDAAGASTAVTSVALRARSVDLRGYTNLSLTWEEQVRALREVLGHVAAERLHLSFVEAPLDDAPRHWAGGGAGPHRPRVVLVPPARPEAS